MTDKEIADQVNHLRVKADMIRMGERIAFGSDSYALECAAETIERLIRERACAVHLGKAGAYKANPECTWAEWAADRQKELDAAEARIAELEAALKPFAAMPCGICENDDPAIGVERCSDDTPVYVTRHDHGGQTVAAGHFRAARAALGRDAT
jgi:hypothetical protein